MRRCSARLQVAVWRTQTRKRRRERVPPIRTAIPAGSGLTCCRLDTCAWAVLSAAADKLAALCSEEICCGQRVIRLGKVFFVVVVVVVFFFCGQPAPGSNFVSGPQASLPADSRPTTTQRAKLKEIIIIKKKLKSISSFSIL